MCLFARAREAFGQADVSLVLPELATATDCFDALVEKSPPLARLRPSLLVAINEEYAQWSAALQEGDEVAFIPPVSGG